VEAYIYVARTQADPTATEWAEKDSKKAVDLASSSTVDLSAAASASAVPGARRSRRNKGQALARLSVTKDDTVVNVKYKVGSLPFFFLSSLLFIFSFDSLNFLLTQDL